MAELNSYRPGSTIQSNPTAGLRSDRYDRMLEERDALKTELSLPSPIQVSAEEYSFLSRSLAGLEGKQRDEMKYRLGSAMAFSRNLGISVEQAYASLPALAKAQLDIEYKPDATTFRSLQDSLAIGVLSSQLSDTANQYMDAYLAGEDVSALDARIKALDSEIQRRQDSAPRWITTKALQMAIEDLPYTADTFATGVKAYALTYMGLTGLSAIGAVAGGPVGLAAAEASKQAISLASAASAVFWRVWKTKESTRGVQFYELVNQGADPSTAAVMSDLSGWMQGLIEETGGPMTSLNRALGMAGKSAGEFSSKVSAYLFLKGKTGRFIRDIGRFGVDVAAEGFEEVQQQFVDDVTDAITYTLSDMEIPEGNWTTPEEYAEAFAGGVGVAAILGVAPSIITSRIEGRQAQTINALAQSGLSEGQFTAAAKSVLPEDITQHASEEDINSLLHTVYENNADRRAKSVLNREGIRTRVQETDKNPQDVNQETAEPTPTIDDEPVRLPSGIYRINGMDEREAEHVPGGGTRLKATVTDPSGKLVYADITYIRRGNTIDIQGIDITEGEHLQTEGFRDDILRQFASMYPDYNVTFSNPRFSAESDSVSRVIASNPRGQQYGLNFGLDFSEEDRAGVAERIRLFNFGEEQKSAAVRLIQMLGAAEGKTGVEFFDSRFQGTITEEEFARLFPEEYARAQSGGGMNAAYIPSSRVPESLRSASDMGNSVRGILVAGRNANPTSFEHEVIHALMQDREKQDSFSDIFAKEMDGQEAFWDFVHKSDLYKDSGVRENFDYIEAHPELFQKGAQWGARQHEFVARLEEMYRLSGQSTRPELRSFFQRLTDFFRRIYRAMKQEGALSDEIVAYFDSFFGTPEDLQARQQSADGSASQASMDEILRQGPISAAEFDEFRRRLLSDPSNFDADGNPLAPNGKRSNLTLEQWITVRTPEFKAWFGDWELDPENASKVVDENGEPKVVYHGSYEDFSVFDRTKTRANMDIQGNFFSPWYEDSMGYGPNVRAFFLNLRNPASESRGYSALEKFKGQTGAGIQARELLISQGYDGVNNSGEEYIAFDSNQIKSATRNSGAFSPESNDIYYQLSPEYVRENMDYETKMPTDEAFLDAVRNTPGTRIEDDGIIVDIERWQKPEQDSEASVRTGVFYLPRGASQSRYYRGGTGFYGGAVHFTGETLLKAPLAVKGATGGNVPLKAYEALFGKEAAKKLEEDCESIMRPYQRSARVNRAMDVYYEYLPYADDDYMDFSTLEINSREGNQLRYAVQENIIAHAVREAGYDSVVGYNRGNLTEIFDVREGNYPSELSSDPWATYIPNDPEKILFQTPAEQQAEAKAKLERLLSASDDEVLREIGNGREFVFNTDIEEALTDIRSIMNVSEDYDEFIGFMEAVRDNSSLDAAARRRLRKALRKRLAGERAEVTVPPEVILNDTGDYIDTYQMLRAEQEGGEGESLAAPVSNDIQGVLGADERENAITGDGDENGEVEDAALRRAMETGEEKREDGETERVIRESDETIRRIDEEQAELESQLAEAEDELSAEDRKAARQEAVIEGLIRESDAKDAVRGFPEGQGDDPARIINRREYIRMWKEFLRQKDRDYIKFWTDYVKTLEKEERDAIKADRKRSEEEYIQWWDEIIRRQDEKYYRNAAREAKRIREAYISWWKKKLDQEAARTSRREAVERTKAKYKAIIKKMEENQRAKDKARRERQQAQRIKRYKESLASRIMRRISANTAVEQADMIRAIQALMTEDDRQNLIIRGERWSVELLREMFRDTPNDPMFSALSPQNLEILTKKRPSDFTVSELENLLDAVNQLRREGLRAWQAVVDARAAEDRAIIRAMVDTVSKNKHYTNPPAPGSDDEAAADTGFRRRFWDAVYNVINLPRIAQLLDNGASDGPFQRTLVRRNREYENAQARAISQRIGVLTKALQELGIKPSDLFKSYDVIIDKNLHGPYSLSQLVYVHYAMNNAKNYQALAYGSLVTPEEKDAIQEQVRKDKLGDPDEKLKTSQLVQGRHTREEEWRAEANERIRKLGDRRYEEFRRQADAILAENPKVMDAAEAVLGDMNGDGFERVQRIMLEQFNRRISKEDFYMPIRRMDWTEVKYDKANAESVRASQLAEEALRGVPRFRPGSVERGFTEERQEISPLQQKPINFDFFQIWQDSVRDEEHLVASMAYVRSLKRVFGDPILQRAITRTHGKEAMGLINEFIQNTAEPWNHIKRDGISNAVRFFRGGLYTSYLGFRASNIIMQAVTSPMPFLSAGVTPAAYMRQLFRFMSDYDQTWQMISELSPMMAERSFDELPALLSEERRAIREQRGSEAEQRIKQSLDKLQEMSLWGLDRVDRVAVGAGWLAIYEREMQRNGGISSEAVRVADDAVLATQPVQRKSEMSRLFRSDNEFARLLTQFTSSLNVVFQNIFFDIPMAYRNRQWGKFWGTIAAYALSGALLFLIRGEPWKDSDDDGEEEFQWRQLIYSFFSQAVDSVPLISDSVSQMVYEPITGESAFTFFGSEFPPLERLARVPGNITEGEWQKALRNSLESIGLFSGIPVLAAEDYWDALVSITQGEAPESLWR